MPEHGIEFENLIKRYPASVTAIDEVSFRVGGGSVFGFLGSNGAGKSTTIGQRWQSELSLA